MSQHDKLNVREYMDGSAKKCRYNAWCLAGFIITAYMYIITCVTHNKRILGGVTHVIVVRNPSF